MATIYSDASASEVHEGDRELVVRLAKLQDLYQQVYQIRKLLPEKLIAPIKQATGSPNAISPASLGGQLKKVAVEGSAQIGSFKKDWHSDEMRSLWEEANSSHHPQGDDCWRADYAALVREMRTSAQSAQEKLGELEEQQEIAAEDPKDVVKVMKERYPALHISVLDDATGLPLDLKVARIPFRVSRVQTETSSSYSVAGKPDNKSSSLTQEIVRFLERRKNTQSLKYILELLASYADVKTRSCDKCGKVFDDDLQLATVKIPKSQDSESGPSWSSFHRTCT